LGLKRSSAIYASPIKDQIKVACTGTWKILLKWYIKKTFLKLKILFNKKINASLDFPQRYFVVPLIM
jgi:hypothetical protein